MGRADERAASCSNERIVWTFPAAFSAASSSSVAAASSSSSFQLQMILQSRRPFRARSIQRPAQLLDLNMGAKTMAVR